MPLHEEARYVIDIDRIADELGIDVLGQNPEPARPTLPLSPVGERMRDEVLGRMERLQISLEMLAEAMRSNPNDDATVDALDVAFGQNLQAARIAFERFRMRRECEGEG